MIAGRGIAQPGPARSLARGGCAGRDARGRVRRQTPVSMIAWARIGTVVAFSPAMFIRLSPTM